MRNTLKYKSATWWVILMAFVYLTSSAQKRVANESDYHLWGTLLVDKLSNNGKWVSFQMQYDEHPDTLFVQSTNGKKRYEFPETYTGDFGADNWFASYNNDMHFTLLDLKAGIKEPIPAVESFEFASNGNHFISLELIDGIKRLKIRDTKKGVTTIDNVVTFKVSPNGMYLVFVRKSNSGIVANNLMLSTGEISPITSSEEGTYTTLEWKEDSSAVAFIHENDPEKESKNELYYFNLNTRRTQHISDDALQKSLPTKRISIGAISRLSVTAAGSVLFGVEPLEKDNRFSPDSIQLWNGNDKFVYTERKNYSNWENIPKMAVWSPKSEIVILINEGRSQLFFNGDMQYAVTYNQLESGPQYKEHRDLKFYVTNLSSGVTKQFLPNAIQLDISISPEGKYLSYFSEGNYWMYTFETNEHTNLTSEIKTVWDDAFASSFELFGGEAWGQGDKTLILHDKFDIYEVELSTLKVKRLTRGREDGCVYRKVRPEPSIYTAKFELYEKPAYNINKPLEVSCKCGTQSSFLLLSQNGKISPQEKGDFEILGVLKAKDADVYIYTKQRFDESPTLMVREKRGNPRELFKSNPFHKNFFCGKSEEIKYQNSKGKWLQGLLTYPANYDASKQYPMVVNIYEKQFYLFHRYQNPSLYNSTGVNSANLSNKGYFVFRHDIEYEVGEPGISATDCTVAAVKAALANKSINPKKIGLIGQSFGGYETNFIITQTNLFSAAVSGASVADLQRHYLSIGWYNGRPEVFRFEHQQWRMGKSLFDDREAYIRNSPVTFVENVTTPLLLWSGEGDRQVHYFQSIAYYLALRRLGKEQIMLLYPNEEHALVKPNFQVDLTTRVEDWFDHYLKDEQKEWISNGTK